MCEHKEDREETGGDWGCRGTIAMVEEGMGDKLEMEREVVFLQKKLNTGSRWTAVSSGAADDCASS